VTEAREASPDFYYGEMEMRRVAGNTSRAERTVIVPTAEVKAIWARTLRKDLRGVARRSFAQAVGHGRPVRGGLTRGDGRRAALARDVPPLPV
jgi:hypothetical protein